MFITESKAVALDAAVDVLLVMYDISVMRTKPIRWLRGDIKKIRESEDEAIFLLTFWICRDPKDAKWIVVGLIKDPIGSWQPRTAAVSDKENPQSKILNWTFKPGESRPIQETE